MKVLLAKVVTVIDKNSAIILFFIFLVFFYLRFFHIQHEGSFGFDQARDAYIARDIVHGKLFTQGPWTGNGHLHIGPLYYYVLAIFFFLFNLDPISANYLNILFNIFNFLAIYYVIMKLAGKKSGLLVVLIYTFSDYYITLNKVAWNVTPMIGLAALIFYGIIQIYEEKYRWFYSVAILAGLYFHAHYTALFLTVIIPLSLVFLKNKKKALKYILLSIPLYLVWFVPNVIGEIIRQNSDAGRYREFFQYFYHGFHLRFFLYLLPYHFVLFSKNFSILGKFFQFILPIVYIVTVIFYEKERREKIIAYIVLMFFLIPIIGFSLYGGTLSEYYYLHTTICILYILIYLGKKLLKIHFNSMIILLSFFWIINFYLGSKNHWIKQNSGGLPDTKLFVRNQILNGKIIPFNEGHMDSYLYTIWTVDGKRF